MVSPVLNQLNLTYMVPNQNNKHLKNAALIQSKFQQSDDINNDT